MKNIKIGTAQRIALVAAALGALITAPADATTVNTNWRHVNYVDYAENTLTIQLNVSGVATNYEAHTTGTPNACPNSSLETLKAWMSLAQSAYLAGREVKIFYDTCGTTTNYINKVQLAD